MVSNENRSSNLGLGIDTGGTNTDAVVVNLDTNTVLTKGMAPTTYHDLSIGIMKAIDGAVINSGVNPADIKLVGLSTKRTLPTSELGFAAATPRKQEKTITKAKEITEAMKGLTGDTGKSTGARGA